MTSHDCRNKVSTESGAQKPFTALTHLSVKISKTVFFFSQWHYSGIKNVQNTVPSTVQKTRLKFWNIN